MIQKVKILIMKKLVFALCALFLAGNLMAQDYEKSYKKAKRDLANYFLDPSTDDKLAEALTKIEEATSGDLSELRKPFDPYLVKGEIYNAIANNQIGAAQAATESPIEGVKMTPPPNNIPVEDAAAKAADAFVKALELADKGRDEKKALEGLKVAQTNLTNMGISAYGAGENEKAFAKFTKAFDLHKIINKAGGESTLDGDENYNQGLYLIGIAGIRGQMYDKVKPYLVMLYERDYDDSFIYSALYAIESQDDAEKAYTYLEAGRKKYPDDSGLLFDEINHFLKIGKLEELIGRLKTAIDAEPDNVSLYTTLGNVYDNLYQREVKEGTSPEKEKEYFDKAYEYYGVATSKDPKNVDAHYSIGALYFNKAALVTQDMIKLNDDLSKEGMKKYDALKKQSTDLFNQALPHFEKAESLDPNDVNTLIALKEIFARIDDIAKSNEFKTRLETVQAGGTNDTPYFKD
jgi:Flp pilus assembly protein TadD